MGDLGKVRRVDQEVRWRQGDRQGSERGPDFRHPDRHEAGDTKRKYSHHLELATEVEVLNEAELKRALKVPRVPKHMKSVPAIKVPVAPGTLDSVAGQGLGEQRFEQVWCFRPGAGGHRSARLVTSLGFEASTENIPPKKTAVRVILMPHALQNDPHSGE